MKSKLVKYPYDEKKYRWDTQEMGKEFEYSWDVSDPVEYEIITPYIKYKDWQNDDTLIYVDMKKPNNPDISNYYDDFEVSATIADTGFNSYDNTPGTTTYNQGRMTTLDWNPHEDGSFYYTYQATPLGISDRSMLIGRQSNYLQTNRIARFRNNNTDTVREVIYQVGGTIPQPEENETLIGYYGVGSRPINVNTNMRLDHTQFDTPQWYSVGLVELGIAEPYKTEVLENAATWGIAKTLNYILSRPAVRKNAICITGLQKNTDTAADIIQHFNDTLTMEVLTDDVRFKWQYVSPIVDRYYALKRDYNDPRIVYTDYDNPVKMSQVGEWVPNTIQYVNYQPIGDWGQVSSNTVFRIHGEYSGPKNSDNLYPIYTFTGETRCYYRNPLHIERMVYFRTLASRPLPPIEYSDVNKTTLDMINQINTTVYCDRMNIPIDIDLSNCVIDRYETSPYINNSTQNAVVYYDSYYESNTSSGFADVRTPHPTIPSDWTNIIYSRNAWSYPFQHSSAYYMNVLDSGCANTYPTRLEVEDITNQEFLLSSAEADGVDRLNYFLFSAGDTGLATIDYYYYYPTYQNADIGNHLTIIEPPLKDIIKNLNYIYSIKDWGNIVGDNYIKLSIDEIPNYSYILLPETKLIGDTDATTVIVPSGNTDILEYIPGYVSNGEFVEKELLYNAPATYSNGNVASYTLLSYNSYTPEEWAGYHYITDEWNFIGLPYAYTNGTTSLTDSKDIIFLHRACADGKYLNIFSLFGDDEVTIEDSLGNELDASPQVFYDNLGPIFVIGGTIQKSTNRHEHPDDGPQNDYYYILRPQDTKFLEYTVDYDTDETINVVLNPDRYYITHEYTEWVDRSWEGTICGSSSSTGEENIPDGTYRIYLGLYLGESIPFLHIVEETIPDSVILGVPEYDKQINTSDTLKYGTVAAASLTVQLDEPVATAINHSGELYVAYYDYFHNNNWDRVGFFRVDSVEAIDEYSSRLTLHDEVYKLNKYADDFLEAYTGSTTLDGFYRDLLDYCGCWYDTHGQPILNGNFELDNVYHAIKTTGIEVAHYIASLVPGFIHANIDGDLELIQYRNSEVQLNPSVISNLTYNAYSSDLLDKVRIVANNAILGEDSGDGENIYFISNNPLISALTPRATLDNLAEDILNTYEEIQTYRPAEISMLYMPGLAAGDMPTVITPTGDVYKIAVMAITINGEGVKITSFGTQTYPVESESSAQFINLINDIDQVSGDVENIERATELIGQTVAETVSDVSALDGRVTATESGLVATNSSLAATASTLSTVVSTISGYSVQTTNNLTSITINSSTASQIVNKTYVEDNTSVSSSSNLGTVSLFGETLSNIALKGYVDSKIGTGVVIKYGSLYWNDLIYSGTLNVLYIGDMNMTNGIFIPTGATITLRYQMFCLHGTSITGFGEGTGSTVATWQLIGSNWNFTEA